MSEPSCHMKPDEPRSLWLAVIAVCCFATAPVALIWAEPLTAYEKSAGRMAIAAVAMLLVALARRQPLTYTWADVKKFALFGLVTALHFLTFVAAVGFTSLAHALTVTYTAPVFVTLFSAWFLNEHIPRRKYLGIAVVILGIAVLVGFEPALTQRMMLGDALALLSAIAFGVYSVIGRSQRNAYPLLGYTLAVYSAAALWLILPAAASFRLAGYGLRQVLALIWVGVVPLAVGHTLYNAAIRRTHATYVNLIATQEVTGGVLLGALLLGQVPTSNSVVGILITLMGLALVLF
jgi:drug/metabolite transporter (DMT)-like permease